MIRLNFCLSFILIFVISCLNAIVQNNSANNEVLKFQRYLKDIGAYTGEINGNVSDDMKGAVTRFQTFNELLVSNNINTNTKNKSISMMKGKLIPEFKTSIYAPQNIVLSGTAVMTRVDSTSNKLFECVIGIMFEEINAKSFPSALSDFYVSGGNFHDTKTNDNQSFDIYNNNFHRQLGIVLRFKSDIDFPSEGETYQVKSTFGVSAGPGAGIGMSNGKIITCGQISVSGTTTINATNVKNVFKIFSDTNNPLELILTKEGARYKNGKGRVITPAGVIYIFN
jgi:hypothetical protein